MFEKWLWNCGSKRGRIQEFQINKCSLLITQVRIVKIAKKLF